MAWKVTLPLAFMNLTETPEGKTIADMIAFAAENTPNKVAFIQSETRITFEELCDNAGAIAQYLLQEGFEQGEAVGIVMDKSLEAITAMLGIMCAGGAAFTVNPELGLDGVRHTLGITRPWGFFVDDSAAELHELLVAHTPESRIVSAGCDIPRNQKCWRDILRIQDRELPLLDITCDDIAYLNFTSGTTGEPKAAITTHGNLFWNTRAAIEALELTPDDVHLSMFPLYGHPHELFCRGLMLGGTSVLIPGISPRSIAENLEQNRVTCMMAVASIYLSLMRFKASHPVDLKHLRIAESGGMHINSAMRRIFSEQKLPIFPAWGSTETAGISLIARPGMESPSGSVGMPCPFYDIQLMNEQGEILTGSCEGELVVGGNGVCRSYLRNEKETRIHLRDGQFHSGDIAVRDGDGFFTIKGRKSRMIKAAGMKVFPIELEEVISRHPAVAEVAVVAAHDEIRGEVPRAVIVWQVGREGSAADIRKQCETALPKYKMPRIIEFVEELPHSPVGKIDYQRIRECEKIPGHSGNDFSKKRNI